MSQKAYIGAEIFDGQNLISGKALVCDGGRVVDIRDASDVPASVQVHVLEGGYITPGFVDVQVNGGGGVMFNDAQTVDALGTIAAAHLATGTRAILPTLITDQFERSQAAVNAVVDAVNQNVAGIAGLHLEGPHLSQARKGAHDDALIRPMEARDLALVIDAAERLPHVMMTVAPENVSIAQVSQLSDAGVIVSLGHTDADFETAVAYMDAGTRCTTHLFNAMSQLGNRSPGLVGATLDTGAVSAGLIADGHHVHPAAIRTALRAKVGPGQIFLVTDAMSSIGSDLTEFELNGRQVFRRDGTLRLPDGTLAGADIDMPRSIAFLVDEAGIPAEEAIRMATSYPANLLGWDEAACQMIGRKISEIVAMTPTFALTDLQRLRPEGTAQVAE